MMYPNTPVYEAREEGRVPIVDRRSSSAVFFSGKTRKMRNSFFYLCLTALVSATLVDARCPKLKLKQNFSTDKYMGTWYEIQSQPSVYQTIKSCLESSYVRVGSGIEVRSKGRDSSGAPATSKSTLRIVDSKNPAHMVTDFVPGISPPFDIVDTDYETFSCAHSCISFFGMQTEYSFVYSRDRTLAPSHVEHCRKIFRGYGIDIRKLADTTQSNCRGRSYLQGLY